MNEKIENQQERINNLLELIKENPNLPIVPMVDSQICAGDDYAWWMGSWGSACIDEYLHDDERIYFRCDDEDELIDKVCDNTEDYPDITEEEAEKIVNNYNWTKCICVQIELPY